MDFEIAYIPQLIEACGSIVKVGVSWSSEDFAIDEAKRMLADWYEEGNKVHARVDIVKSVILI